MIPTIPLAPLFSDEVRRDPYAYYRQLHRLGSVFRIEPDDAPYRFLVAGYDAADRVLRDATFMVMDDTLITRPPSWDEQRTHAVFLNSMMFTNAPRQTRMRRLFSHAFTPRRIAALEPGIVQICARLLDDMAEAAAAGRPVDIMTDYAYPMPAAVLGHLLGVPEADLEWYRPRAAELAKVIELGGSTADNMRRADAAAVELTDYFADLVEQRRRDPRDDVISDLARSCADDPDVLTQRELLSNLVVVFNAGFVTTVHLLGNGLTTLLDHPHALAALSERPELAPDYIDEILRCEGPTHFVVRWAVADTEIGGTAVPRGSGVLVLLAAANRDPARFVDPDRFDPGRTGTHLAFSSGPHYCLGAALARMEGVHGLTMLLQRFPRLRLTEQIPPPHQLMLRGHDTLRVEVEPRVSVR